MLRIISVGLDRPSKPRDRLLPTAEVVLRKARVSHPDVSHRIARTEAQGLGNVSLGFFGATDKNLSKSDSGMGAGEISIQRQRMFAFGDALRSALGEYVDKSQQHMADAHGPGPTTRLWSTLLRPQRRPPWDRSQRNCALDRVRARRSNERVDIVGIGDERAIEKVARLRDIVRGQTLIEPSQTLKIEVHRVGGRGLFRASRLGGDELGVQRAREPRDDFILHVEEIGQGLIEPLGPEMIARFGVDELHVDAHAVSAALNAALQHIADVQLAPDLLHVDGLALVGERRVARDHDRASYPREVGREAFRDPVDEMLLLRVAADIGERQDDDREARRADFSGAGAGTGFASAGAPTSSE